MNARRRLAALLEVLGVYLAAQLVTTFLIGMLGIQIGNPLERLTTDITNAELLTATRELFILMMLQYAGYFLLILPLSWCHRRRDPAAYGLTRAGRSWAALLLAGVGTVAAVALVVWPASTLVTLDNLCNLGLGETVPWRRAIFDMSWRRWEFWLFMAVVSFALIPVAEELFYRGYCQRRLAEEWGDGPAAIGTALLFTFAHSQYLILNAYNVCMIVTLLPLAIGFGVVFAWSRSLIPSMVAHAIINFPVPPSWGLVILAAFVIGGIVIRRQAVAVIQRVFSGASMGGCVALGAIGTGWAIAGQQIDRLYLVAAGMVVVAVGLGLVDHWRSRVAILKADTQVTEKPLE
jgi:membrane protease YdiL (CAAX protease family)